MQLILAGASAVAVGTANFVDPRAVLSIQDGIARYMDRHDVTDLAELIGAVKDHA